MSHHQGTSPVVHWLRIIGSGVALVIAMTAIIYLVTFAIGIILQALLYSVLIIMAAALVLGYTDIFLRHIGRNGFTRKKNHAWKFEISRRAFHRVR